MSDEPKLEGEILVTVEHKIPLERVRDLLTCATEGGIGYWALIAGYRGDRTGVTYPHIDMPFKEGGAILIQDEEDDTAPINVLDMEAIQRGLHIMADKYPHHMSAFLDDNEDATTGDVFVQCALFGTIVYV